MSGTEKKEEGGEEEEDVILQGQAGYSEERQREMGFLNSAVKGDEIGFSLLFDRNPNPHIIPRLVNSLNKGNVKALSNALTHANSWPAHQHLCECTHT